MLKSIVLALFIQTEGILKSKTSTVSAVNIGEGSQIGAEKLRNWNSLDKPSYVDLIATLDYKQILTSSYLHPQSQADPTNIIIGSTSNNEPGSNVGAWVAKNTAVDEFLMVTFDEEKKLLGVVTQG